MGIFDQAAEFERAPQLSFAPGAALLGIAFQRIGEIARFLAHLQTDVEHFADFGIQRAVVTQGGIVNLVDPLLEAVDLLAERLQQLLQTSLAAVAKTAAFFFENAVSEVLELLAERAAQALQLSDLGAELQFALFEFSLQGSMSAVEVLILGLQADQLLLQLFAVAAQFLQTFAQGCGFALLAVKKGACLLMLAGELLETVAQFQFLLFVDLDFIECLLEQLGAGLQAGLQARFIQLQFMDRIVAGAQFCSQLPQLRTVAVLEKKIQQCRRQDDQRGNQDEQEQSGFEFRHQIRQWCRERKQQKQTLAIVVGEGSSDSRLRALAVWSM